MMTSFAKSFTTGFVWFKHTDLRIRDNDVLRGAHAECTKVFHAYVIDPSQFQLQDQSSKQSVKRLKFLSESLADLNTNLEKFGSKLHVYSGKTELIIPDIMTQLETPKLYFHDEYIYEEKQLLKSTVSSLGGRFPVSSYWGGGTIYETKDLPFDLDRLSMFTSFRKSMEGNDRTNPKIPMLPPADLPEAFRPSPEVFVSSSTQPLNDMTSTGILKALLEVSMSSECNSQTDPLFSIGAEEGINSNFKGGESAAWDRINHYITNGEGKIDVYKETRNGMIGMDYSSKLSPWLAVGAISSRQVVKAVKDFEARTGIKNDSTYWLIFELLWRDYMKFYGIKWGRRMFLLGGAVGKSALNKYPWKRDANLFDKWARGLTGYPLVDANMRELLATGFMSNRGRQIVASFLVRDLGLDWRLGAQHFESHLLDHDVCSNWGNWNYGAGVGSDPREDRYFNILKQGKSYDPDGAYIRLWCPEIASLPTECLLNAALINDGTRTKYGISTEIYPSPCCKLMHTSFKGDSTQSGRGGRGGKGNESGRSSGKQNRKKENAYKQRHGGVPGLTEFN